MVGHDTPGNARRVVYVSHARCGPLDVGVVVSPRPRNGAVPVTGQALVWSVVQGLAVPLFLGAVYMVGTRIVREVTR